MTDRREAGKARMRDVYGWDFEPTKPFEIATVDHLFGEVWGQSDMSVAQNRLLLVGLTVGSGQIDVAALQIETALRLGELTVRDCRHLVVFLAHYAGWPRAAALNSEVENIITRYEAASAED